MGLVGEPGKEVVVEVSLKKGGVVMGVETPFMSSNDRVFFGSAGTGMLGTVCGMTAAAEYPTVYNQLQQGSVTWELPFTGVITILSIGSWCLQEMAASITENRYNQMLNTAEWQAMHAAPDSSV